MALNVDVSKIESCKVRLGDGTVAVIHPKQIAQRAQGYIDMLLANPDTKFLAPYLAKKIIWSFRPDTAWTDGIRITVNPVFAYEKIAQGVEFKLLNLAKITAGIQNEDAANNAINNAIAKYFQFVIVHECYHQVYLHMLRWEKIGGRPDLHDIANIAMDMEINRDIEAQLGKYFNGCTEAINGIWFKDPKFKKNEQYMKDHPSQGEYFSYETWEKIFNYLLDYPVEWNNQTNENLKGGDPKELNHPEKYEAGWNDAIDAIESKKIDPRKL